MKNIFGFGGNQSDWKIGCKKNQESSQKEGLMHPHYRGFRSHLLRSNWRGLSNDNPFAIISSHSLSTVTGRILLMQIQTGEDEYMEAFSGLKW